MRDEVTISVRVPVPPEIRLSLLTANDDVRQAVPVDIGEKCDVDGDSRRSVIYDFVPKPHNKLVVPHAIRVSDNQRIRELKAVYPLMPDL